MVNKSHSIWYKGTCQNRLTGLAEYAIMLLSHLF